MEHPGVVSYGGILSHSGAVEAMCSADALYFLSFREKGLTTGKIFGYLASGRPILSVPGDGDVTDTILAETKAGKVAASPGEVARVLKQWCLEWKATGRVSLRPDEEQVSKYSWHKLARELAGLLDDIVSR